MRVDVASGILALLGAALAACAPGAPALQDLEGRPVDPFADEATATVFLFLRTDCPISNRYAPELRRLRDEYTPRGVVFHLVYPDPEEPVASIRAHLREYGLAAAALRDPRHVLVRRAGVTVTPEAVVYLPDGRRVYRGRVDDRWVAFGEARAVPTRQDLREVLEAVVAGREITPSTTEAIGCFIPGLS